MSAYSSFPVHHRKKRTVFGIKEIKTRLISDNYVLWSHIKQVRISTQQAFIIRFQPDRFRIFEKRLILCRSVVRIKVFDAFINTDCRNLFM